MRPDAPLRIDTCALRNPNCLGDQRDQRGIGLAVDRRRLDGCQPAAVGELARAFPRARPV